jgi:hypothetical protein
MKERTSSSSDDSDPELELGSESESFIFLSLTINSLDKPLAIVEIYFLSALASSMRSTFLKIGL